MFTNLITEEVFFDSVLFLFWIVSSKPPHNVHMSYSVQGLTSYPSELWVFVMRGSKWMWIYSISIYFVLTKLVRRSPSSLHGDDGYKLWQSLRWPTGRALSSTSKISVPSTSVANRIVSRLSYHFCWNWVYTMLDFHCVTELFNKLFHLSAVFLCLWVLLTLTNT